MTWEEALSYSDIIKDVAAEWAYRCKDPSLQDDISQTLYIGLVEKVDLARAEKDPRIYVRAACWKLAEKMVTSPSKGVWRFVSLDALQEGHLQIDDEGHLRPIYGHSDQPFPYRERNPSRSEDPDE